MKFRRKKKDYNHCKFNKEPYLYSMEQIKLMDTVRHCYEGEGGVNNEGTGIQQCRDEH